MSNRDFTISFWAYREESVYDNDAAYDGGGVYIAKRDADGWRSRMEVILTPASTGSITTGPIILNPKTPVQRQ